MDFFVRSVIGRITFNDVCEKEKGKWIICSFRREHIFSLGDNRHYKRCWLSPLNLVVYVDCYSYEFGSMSWSQYFITLSCCSYHVENVRFVVIGKRVWRYLLKFKKQVIYNAKKSINEEILTNLPPYCILKYQYIYQKISNQNKKQVVFYLVGVT